MCPNLFFFPNLFSQLSLLISPTFPTLPTFPTSTISLPLLLCNYAASKHVVTQPSTTTTSNCNLPHNYRADQQFLSHAIFAMHNSAPLTYHHNHYLPHKICVSQLQLCCTEKHVVAQPFSHHHINTKPLPQLLRRPTISLTYNFATQASAPLSYHHHHCLSHKSNPATSCTN